MSAQSPVGVTIPPSRTARSTIEVAVLEATFGNCTSDCMRCANPVKGFPQLDPHPIQPRVHRRKVPSRRRCSPLSRTIGLPLSSDEAPGERLCPLSPFLNRLLVGIPPAQKALGRVVVVLEHRDQGAHDLGLARCAEPSYIQSE